MGTGIFSFFPSFNMAGAGTVALWTLIFVLIGVCGVSLFIMVLIKKKSTNFLELNLVNKKATLFSGRRRKTKTKQNHLWIGKLKKYLPGIQQDDIYTKKTNDFVVLLKDRNGLHHTARLPTEEELKRWYKVQYGIENLDELKQTTQEEKGVAPWIKKKVLTQEQIGNMYLIPNPCEDLDWLGDQCVEADKEFAEVWWKSPAVMMIGVAMVCAFMFIITLVINAKFVN